MVLYGCIKSFQVQDLYEGLCILCNLYFLSVSVFFSLIYSIFSLPRFLFFYPSTPLHLSSTSLSSCTPELVQSEAKEMSGVSSISLGNCDSVFSSVRLNHLPLEEQWGGPYPGPKSNLNPQRLLKPLQVISIQTRGKSTNMRKHLFCYFVVLYLLLVLCPIGLLV